MTQKEINSLQIAVARLQGKVHAIMGMNLITIIGLIVAIVAIIR